MMILMMILMMVGAGTEDRSWEEPYTFPRQGGGAYKFPGFGSRLGEGKGEGKPRCSNTPQDPGGVGGFVRSWSFPCEWARKISLLECIRCAGGTKVRNEPVRSGPVRSKNLTGPKNSVRSGPEKKSGPVRSKNRFRSQKKYQTFDFLEKM